MRFLVVGLGSMGKRRIRCLQALGMHQIYGFDLREDRRAEAKDKYGITVFSNLYRQIEFMRPDAMIISVPPDIHHIYIMIALKYKINFFVEASVLDTGLAGLDERCKDEGIVGVPSATMLFHPVIKTLEFRKLSNIIYHCGQYLPDWHTYENVSDYYVSNPATGGAREIVPFELTWMFRLFGYPKNVQSMVRKTIDIPGAEQIDDTYNVLLDYEDHLAVLTVDVVSRAPQRRLVLNGADGFSCFDLNNGISEQMYVDEMAAFIEATKGGTPFPNTFEQDLKVLNWLYTMEM